MLLESSQCSGEPPALPSLCRPVGCIICHPARHQEGPAVGGRSVQGGVRQPLWTSPLALPPQSLLPLSLEI